MRLVNEYDLSGEYGKCFIKSDFFIFDKEDYEKIKDYRWFLREGYPCANKDKTCKKMFFHRFIMNCPRNKVVDHINHNKLDNRKSNLRICSIAENSHNVVLSKNNTSGCKGVNFVKSANLWRATIQCNRKRMYIGSFKSKEEAIKARKEAEQKYWGEYAYKEV